MKILIATGNKHKFEELIAILPSKTQTGKALEYVSLKDIAGLEMPEETGASLEENARLKACYAAQLSGLLSISDDTGLEVAFLNGRPGIHTARYAGEQADTEQNNRKLLNELEGLFLGKRSARFRTVACIASPEGNISCYEGILEGFIAPDYRGKNGFGYDPLFIVKGTSQTLAEMTAEQKNKISHRARAFEKVAQYLVSIQ